MPASNTQEFVTVIRLNSEEARNNLEQLKKRVDDLTAARDKAITAKADTNFIKDLNKDLKKARAELKAYDAGVNKVIATINNLSDASVGEIEAAMKSLRRQMKTASDPKDWRSLSSMLDLCRERLDEIKSGAEQTGDAFNRLSANGKLVASVMVDMDNASEAALKAAQSAVEKRMETLSPNSDDYRKSNEDLLKIKARLAELADKHKLVNTIVGQYNAEIRQAGQEMRQVATNTQLVERTLKSLDRASVRDIEYSLKIVNEELRGMERGTQEFRQMTLQARRLRTQLEAVRREGAAQESWINRMADRFNRMQTLIVSVIASLTGLSLTVRKSVQDFLDMDTAMADVAKYTGQTMEEVEAMNETFKRMDTRTSREELNALAAAAGRLGITNEKMITEFVDGADKIRVALGDDLGDNAVQEIGKLAQMFGEDEKKGLRGAMLATGSAINELAQNSSAAASYMVDFTSQLSGVAVQAGMTQSEMLGLASALDQNNQEAATSATVFSQLITKMFQDPARFAKIAGLEVKEFARIMREDANTGVLAFVEAMGKRGGFDAMAPLFEEMRLDGTRAVGVLSSVAAHIGQVREAQALAFQAYNEGTSVVREFNNMNDTQQARLDKTKKDFHDLSVDLGKELLPAMRYLVTTGTMLTKGLYALVVFLKQHKTEIISLTAAIIALTVAYNAASVKAWAWYAKENALMLLHKAHNVLIKTRIALIGSLQVAMALLTGNVNRAAAAMRAMRAAGLTNPYTALLAVVLSLGYGIYKLAAYIRGNSEEAKRNAAALERMKKSYGDVRDIQKEASSAHAAEISQVKMLRSILEDANNGLHARRKALVQLQGIVPQYHATLTAEGKLINNNTSALDAYVKRLRDASMAQAAMNKMTGLNANLMDVSMLREQREANQRYVVKQLAKYGFDPKTMDYGRSATNNYIRDLSTNRLTKISDGQMEGIERWMKAYNYNVKKIGEYTEAAGNLNDRIDKVQDFATRQGVSLADNTSNTPGSPSSTYTPAVSQKESDKQIREREKAYKKELKDAETAMKTSLVSVDALYVSGEIKYTEYIKQRLEALQSGYDGQLEVMRGYGKTETEEYKNMLAKKQEADAQYYKDKTKMELQWIERGKAQAEAGINARYNDPDSGIYMDEAALNEALFQNEINYLERKKTLYKESAEEYRQIELEIEDRQTQHKLDQETWYRDKWLHMRQDYLEEDRSARLEMEIATLDKLHAMGLVAEEEYRQARLAIYAKYSERELTEEEERRKNAQKALSVARDRAGVGDEDKQPDNAFGSIAYMFTSVEQQKKVNDALKELYDEELINYEEYQAAKEENDNAFWEGRLQAATVALNSISSMLGAVSSYAQACADAETAKIQAEYDKQIEAAGSNTKKREKLEEERDEKIRQVKNEANKKAMPIEIAQAIASTATNALNAFGAVLQPAQPWTVPLAYAAAAAATASGMLQVATIKKQHEAQAAGYYEGGFTGGNNYRREAGVVHEGEFVANHNAVNNAAIRPALQLIDMAQRNNTVGSLRAADVSKALGGGTNAVVAPVVNVQTDTAQQEAVRRTLADLGLVVERLNRQLDGGITAIASIDGDNGIAKQLKHYEKLMGNK